LGDGVYELGEWAGPDMALLFADSSVMLVCAKKDAGEHNLWVAKFDESGYLSDDISGPL
jgi:hypothetical protein|tara:strand:+ start:141 stop:317 length:177 start_codon:yes stop_codon:yes gene_type:complete